MEYVDQSINFLEFFSHGSGGERSSFSLNIKPFTGIQQQCLIQENKVSLFICLIIWRN